MRVGDSLKFAQLAIQVTIREPRLAPRRAMPQHELRKTRPVRLPTTNTTETDHQFYAYLTLALQVYHAIGYVHVCEADVVSV